MAICNAYFVLTDSCDSLGSLLGQNREIVSKLLSLLSFEAVGFVSTSANDVRLFALCAGVLLNLFASCESQKISSELNVEPLFLIDSLSKLLSNEWLKVRVLILKLFR